jgi:hypothetical protein
VNVLPIVVALDVSEQIPPCLFARRPAPLMDQFSFQGKEERLHGSVVITASRSAHRGLGLHGGQLPGIRLRRMLTTAIRMVNEPGTWSLPLSRHHQSAKSQPGAHMIAHGPTHHLPGGQIQHSRQVEPALTSRDVGDVGQTRFGTDIANSCCRRLALLKGFNQAYNRRRQRVLKGASPEQVVQRRLAAEPKLADVRFKPPDPRAHPQALQVVAHAKEVSHPDS